MRRDRRCRRRVRPPPRTDSCMAPDPSQPTRAGGGNPGASGRIDARARLEGTPRPSASGTRSRCRRRGRRSSQEGPESSSGSSPTDSRAISSAGTAPSRRTPGSRPGQVDDRGRRADERLVGAQVDTNEVAERLLELVARGGRRQRRNGSRSSRRAAPLAARTASASGCAGSRTPIVVPSPPSDHPADPGVRGQDERERTRPGARARPARPARRTRATARAASRVGTRTGSVRPRGRCFASKSRAVASGSSGRVPIPYTVSVGNTMSSPPERGRRGLRGGAGLSATSGLHRREHAVPAVQIAEHGRLDEAHPTSQLGHRRTGVLLDLLHDRSAGPQPHERRAQEPLGEREVTEERQRRIGERVRGQLVRPAGRDVRRIRHDQVDGPPELGREPVEQVAPPARPRRGRAGSRSPGRARPRPATGPSPRRVRPGVRPSRRARSPPIPCPRSTTAGERTDAIRSRATPATTSVSGRGTNTPGRTSRTSRRNPSSRVRCCSGVPVQRKHRALP